MSHRLLTARWLAAHVALVAAVAICCLLGWWQLDRAQAQHEASLRPAVNAAAVPVPLETLLAPGDRLASNAVGRRVTVRGTYDIDNQLLVPDEMVGGRTGYAVLTPLLVGDTALVVVRGWVAQTIDGAPPPIPSPAAGDVTVDGWLGAGDEPPALDALPAGQVGSVHLPSLVNLLPYPLFDGVVNRTAENPAPATQLTALPPELTTTGGSWPIQNLFYAVEWWVFGLAAVAIWVSAIRRRDPEPVGPSLSGAGGGPAPSRPGSR